jgi:hypothetical protein
MSVIMLGTSRGSTHMFVVIGDDFDALAPTNHDRYGAYGLAA